MLHDQVTFLLGLIKRQREEIERVILQFCIAYLLSYVFFMRVDVANHLLMHAVPELVIVIAVRDQAKRISEEHSEGCTVGSVLVLLRDNVE